MISFASLVYVMVFASAAILIYGLLQYRDSRRTIQERVSRKDGSVGAMGVGPRKENPAAAWFGRLLTRWGSWAAKDEERLSAVRQQLIYAGFRHHSAPVMYFGLRVVTAMLLPLPYLLSQLARGLATKNTLLYAFLITGLGYFLPYYLLRYQVSRRQNSIDRALPDVLDLFIICAEAGLSLPATINKVAAEIKEVSREFYQELMLTALELRTGLPWNLALHHLGERTGVLSVKSFVSLLVQTDKLGTNVAQAMRTQANFTRTQRALKAEELANKLPVKMLFPLVLFIFPGIFIVIAGPGVIQIINVLLPMMKGKG
jgi:tight adherence protein C